MADNLPGKGVFGWLGRQVGYVKKAAKAKPAALPQPGPKAAPAAKPNRAPSSDAPTVVYREGRVEEAEHPTQPGLKLRRTVIDEVIAEQNPRDPRDVREGRDPSPAKDEP